MKIETLSGKHRTFGNRTSRAAGDSSAIVELQSFRRQPRRIFSRLLPVCGALGLALIALAIWATPSVRLETASILASDSAEQATSQSEQFSNQFSLCFTGGGTNCVVDGDTFWINGEKVRVADIDAPETHPSRCSREAELGSRAANRLQALLNAGPIEMTSIDRDEDVYGRKLRIVRRNGQSLGLMLVTEGLAREWGGARRPWC